MHVSRPAGEVCDGGAVKVVEDPAECDCDCATRAHETMTTTVLVLANIVKSGNFNVVGTKTIRSAGAVFEGK